MGIWACGHMRKNMAKWGIPEKSVKNAAQRCWPQVRRTLQSKVIAKNRFLHILSSFLECKRGIFFRAKYTHKFMIDFFKKKNYGLIPYLKTQQKMYPAKQFKMFTSRQHGLVISGSLISVWVTSHLLNWYGIDESHWQWHWTAFAIIIGPMSDHCLALSQQNWRTSYRDVPGHHRDIL